ncbi:MAG TPA: sugar ABC transporter ATP-binding protein [Polyangiaceae bacterium]
MTLLSIRGVHKHFGAVQAVQGVDLDVRAGEVHALIGENGAGKSTLLKLLSGALKPDAGTITWDGAPFHPSDPRAAAALGVRMIYQETTLAPQLTIAENIALGAEPRRFGFVRKRAARDLARRALARLGHADRDVDRRVSELGPGERQLVEIARALAADARLLILDEPTSSLSRQDAARLLELVRRLAADGVAVIYVSHFLEEVLRVADRYTVLRDGRSVATGDAADATARQLVEQMAGRPIEDVFPAVPHQAGEVLLEVAGLIVESAPGVSFSLRRGEILGLAGLLGAGRTEALRALFGLDAARGGTIRVRGAADRWRRPWVRLAQGVGLLSEDRATEGLALGMSVVDNLTLCHLGRTSKWGFIRRSAQQRRAEHWIRALGIRCADPTAPAFALSGGNQQKVALARLLDRDVDVALLDEPTRGVDVASRAAIYRAVGELAAAGKAVLFVSSYLPELLGVCDRIGVMHRGRLVAARPTSEWTEATLLETAATGAAVSAKDG